VAGGLFSQLGGEEKNTFVLTEKWGGTSIRVLSAIKKRGANALIKEDFFASRGRTKLRETVRRRGSTSRENFTNAFGGGGIEGEISSFGGV